MTPYVMWVEVEFKCAFVSVCIQFSDLGVATCERKPLLYLNVVQVFALLKSGDQAQSCAQTLVS